MNILEIKKNKIDGLKKINHCNDILMSESDLCIFYYHKVKYVLKELYPFEYIKYENKLRTLLSIDANTDIIPEYFIKPRFLVSDGASINYWGSNFRDGANLELLLSSDAISFNEKKRYLIRIGSILKEMDDIRRKTSLKDFYIGDLHESNFIISQNGDLLVCDVDSIKIGGNKPSNAKYLTPFSLFNGTNSNKYKYDYSKIKVGDYAVDRNTDLYCYMMILLNFISNSKINNSSVKEFYDYLNYLNDIKMDSSLLESFNRILSNEDNTNPYEFIDTLTEEQVNKARRRKL